MKKNILCLKHGTKYSSDYVNRLHQMVSRHLTYEHDFFCLTEDASELNENIKIIPLKVNSGVDGWWYKPTVFNPELKLEGTILFFDLDVVIFKNINHLFDYEKGKFCVIRDYYLKRKNRNGMNSSCFRFESGTNEHVYYDFVKESSKIIGSMHGDQDWFQKVIQDDFVYWPDSWIKSYKWEMYTERDLIKNGENYVVRKLPQISEDSCVAVFHGKPKPHEIDSDWIRKNWR